MVVTEDESSNKKQHYIKHGVEIAADTLKSFRYSGDKMLTRQNGWHISDNNEVSFNAGHRYSISIKQDAFSDTPKNILKALQEIDPILAMNVIVLISSKCALSEENEDNKKTIKFSTSEIFNGEMNKDEDRRIELIISLVRNLQFMDQSEWIAQKGRELKVRKFEQLFSVERTADVLVRDNSLQEFVAGASYTVQVHRLGNELFSQPEFLYKIPLAQFNSKSRFRGMATYYAHTFKVMLIMNGVVEKSGDVSIFTMTIEMLLDEMGLLPNKKKRENDRSWLKRTFNDVASMLDLMSNEDGIISNFSDFKTKGRASEKWSERWLKFELKITIPNSYFSSVKIALNNEEKKLKKTIDNIKFPESVDVIKTILSLPKKYKQADIARLLSVSKGSITHYKKGRRGIDPGVRKKIKIIFDV